MENLNERRFIISNISRKTLKKHVQSFLDQEPPFVNLEDFTIARDAQYNPLPHGLVEFEDVNTKEQALGKSGQQMHNRHVVIEDFVADADAPRPMFFHVPGLPLHVNRGSLQNLLNRFVDDTVEVAVPINRANPRLNKGYAFIFVKSHASYQAILAAAAAREVRVGTHVLTVVPGVRGGVVM